MAWCKVSSLTAAVARSLKGVGYPSPKSQLMAVAHGKTVEGWELSFFLGKALAERKYPNLRSVISDLEDWLERQG